MTTESNFIEKEKLISDFFEVAREADKYNQDNDRAYQVALRILSEKYPFFNRLGEDGRAIPGVKTQTKIALLVANGLSMGLNEFYRNVHGADTNAIQHLRTVALDIMEFDVPIKDCLFDSYYSREDTILLFSQALDGIEALGR